MGGRAAWYLDIPMPPPRFITFEGIDGSGKSTHLRRAAQWLASQGIACRQTHEPGGTPLGDALRLLFLDPRWGAIDGTVELLMLFASRRQHLLEVIEPALLAGEVVLCDRFTDSTRAYQGSGRGVPLGLIDQVDLLATGGRRPDRTLLFDLPAAAARARRHAPGRGRHRARTAAGGTDRLDAEDLDFYERVRQGFLEQARREPHRFRIVESGGDPARTAAQVREALADLLPAGKVSA
ncbi:MAG: dTMP kinase [Acidobacteria bacterium]|nr:dTMP kinase [Acidobacteriota bacterium]